MGILFYGEFKVHHNCQWERRVIHTKIVYICFTQVYVYGIEYFPFHSVFHSVLFSVPRFSNTRTVQLIKHISLRVVTMHIQVHVYQIKLANNDIVHIALI